ncbi:glycosyl transferase family 2 [Solirubrobacter pauli]|uniref:Glycosyl transferase family 2 n=1 Tax=Solirubrobacter pauli TaxID=166793 RepID=A0A660L503_9ACTN|nr:glycosyltransferase [Solirubrobacter pauli]RKQ88264.1 glycosyl transferase family 2 [Solirubrobacter pauli]
MRLILDPAVRLYDGGRVLAARGRIIGLAEGGPAALRALLADTATPAQRRLGERLLDAGFAHPRPDPRPHADVTIVIPVKDDAPGLARCLAALAPAPPPATSPPPATTRPAAPPPPATTQPAAPPPAAPPPTATPPAATPPAASPPPAGPFTPRVIVVDDGSRDPVAIARAAHPARVVRRERCGGPAAARNTGLDHARTELVAFLDADTIPSADWVERLAGHFDDPRVKAVAPRIRAANRRRSPLDLGARRSVPYVPSAALIVRTPVRFDETLRYGEDVDLVWRLQDAGHRVVYDPSVVVLHHERDTLRRRFRYGTSAAPLAARHPARLRHIHLTRPRPLALARVLQAKHVPRHVALVWTVRSLEQSAVGIAHLASAYGLGVAWGKIRGLPTISGPRIP